MKEHNKWTFKFRKTYQEEYLKKYAVKEVRNDGKGNIIPGKYSGPLNPKTIKVETCDNVALPWPKRTPKPRNNFYIQPPNIANAKPRYQSQPPQFRNSKTVVQTPNLTGKGDEPPEVDGLPQQAYTNTHQRYMNMKANKINLLDQNMNNLDDLQKTNVHLKKTSNVIQTPSPMKQKQLELISNTISMSAYKTPIMNKGKGFSQAEQYIIAHSAKNQNGTPKFDPMWMGTTDVELTD